MDFDSEPLVICRVHGAKTVGYEKSVEAVENINSHAETGLKYAANRAYRRGIV